MTAPTTATLATEVITRTSTGEALTFWLLGTLAVIGAIGVLLYLDVKLALLTFCVVPFVAGASVQNQAERQTAACAKTVETGTLSATP